MAQNLEELFKIEEVKYLQDFILDTPYYSTISDSSNPKDKSEEIWKEDHKIFLTRIVKRFQFSELPQGDKHYRELYELMCEGNLRGSIECIKYLRNLSRTTKETREDELIEYFFQFLLDHSGRVFKSLETYRSQNRNRISKR